MTTQLATFQHYMTLNSTDDKKIEDGIGQEKYPYRFFP